MRSRRAIRSEADLLAAARSQEAEEGDHLDLKRELPPGDTGAREIAKDLAAMALGGGVILVGVDEGPPAVLTPITLAGQRERVENIARGIDPPVPCQIEVIRKDPPVTGYLVITIPVSDEAPHAIQGRFYGRFGSISAPLKHNEVRRLFEDRAHQMAGEEPPTVATDPPIGLLLDEWVQADPTPEDQRRQAHIFVVARPRQAAALLLQEAVGTDWEAWTRRAVVDGRDRLTHAWAPDLGNLWRFDRVPGGWRGTTDQGPWQHMHAARETHWLELEFRENGLVRLFCGRGSDHYRGVRVIMEVVVGGAVRRALEAAIRVTYATGYEGVWDAGVALTGLAGAVSYFRMANWWVDPEDLPQYPEDNYHRLWTGTAAVLRSDPDAVVDNLLGSINRTLNDGRFQLPAPPPTPELEDDEEAHVTG